MNNSLTPEQLAMLTTGVGLVILIVSLLIAIAIAVLVILFLQSCLNKLPAEHRQQSPGMVWLLLIPCFNLVWIFFVYPKIAESFQSYFASAGRTDVGDCGLGLAKTYCILVVSNLGLSLLGMIPVIGAIFGLLNCACSIAILVVWIMTLVKFAGLKRQVA